MSRRSSSAKPVTTRVEMVHSGDSHATTRKADLFALIAGAIDAHINHLDYFDTIGGDELWRLLVQYRTTHAVGGRSIQVGDKQALHPAAPSTERHPVP